MNVEPSSVCEQSISAAAPGSSGASSRGDASIHGAKPLSITREQVCLHFPAVAIGMRTTCHKQTTQLGAKLSRMHKDLPLEPAIPIG